jgi:hypothetical protein
MTAVPLLFISVFILIQCILGVALLYRGYALVLGHFQMESWRDFNLVVTTQLKAMTSSPNWRRALLALSLLLPGSIPVLLIIAGWRAFRRGEFSALFRTGTRWFRTAKQNIA